jgi:hypothetical protein
MAIRGLLYQLTATIGELSNARHYPLSHAKVQAKPAEKGQVYFGRFYLGKCRRSPEGGPAYDTLEQVGSPAAYPVDKKWQI